MDRSVMHVGDDGAQDSSPSDSCCIFLQPICFMSEHLTVVKVVTMNIPVNRMAR